MSTSKKQSQASFSGKLPPPKPKNADVRPREYLTDKEVDRLMKAASKVGRHGHRDSTLILVTYRHGFRVSELVALGWNQVELDSGKMHVNRAKEGLRVDVAALAVAGAERILASSIDRTQHAALLEKLAAEL